jgi:hypothetical protein
VVQAPSGFGGDAEHVDVSGSDLHDEEHVQPAERDRAVDVEEVAAQGGGGLGAQESSPGRVVAADRCWWDPGSFADAADRGRGDAVAE